MGNQTPEDKIFYLVESRAGPSDGQGFKAELNDDETFETDFIGASEQDCQQWAVEKQSQHNIIEQDIIAIADVRSATDSTLLMQHYVHKEADGEEPLQFGRYGVLPRERDTWHDFRIDPSGADNVLAALEYVTFDVSYPVYFGHKEELTDEHGVFDVARAQRLMEDEDPSIFEF